MFSNEEKKEWQLEIIPNENLIRFNAPDVMFSQSNFKLNDRFKFIINSFFPRYVKVLSKFGTLISDPVPNSRDSPRTPGPKTLPAWGELVPSCTLPMFLF